MQGRAAYRDVPGAPIGVDWIFLPAFGDPIATEGPPAAAIKVDGYTQVQVFAPIRRRTWGASAEAEFRDAVRDVASRHPVRGKGGAVTLVFDPSEEGVDDGTGSLGEPVDR